ncbi:hypothetical protein PR001_g4507 [Phytophthora rubi]|uniref:Secreted protein n=1 Tax=Phytophthora rubi TaxID=129364 RepID=A0A6A3NAC2_9STRA|nr:hypothetical protein PR002_g3919 [Phytophthora rubi]KAE9046597.1 hypothetical protein PR001_g4507 [Phytophthora rubi]
MVGAGGGATWLPVAGAACSLASCWKSCILEISPLFSCCMSPETAVPGDAEVSILLGSVRTIALPSRGGVYSSLVLFLRAG